MALSVELLKRLNADEEPLPKRLKLAENTFYATDVPIIRKEEIILQWLCDKCTTDRTVWDLLKNCLRTRNLNIKVAVKKVLIDVLIERLQNDIQYLHSDIFECCSLLVSNIGIQQYFVSKPDDLGLLTKSLLECVYKVFKHVLEIDDQSTEGINITAINKCDGLILQAYNTTICVLENIIQIFKSAFTTKAALRTLFVRDILYPLCIIIDHKCTDNTNRLGAMAHKCIQQLIFGRKYIQSGEFLKEEDLTGFKTLLTVLMENARMKSLPHNLMTITFFFRVAVTVFKSDSTVLDTILRELVECSGIYRKEILNSLLKHLNDVTFDCDHKINDVTLFDYCQSIISDILISKSMSNIDYNLLAQFSNFNPLIIERRIQEVLRKVFLEKSTLEYENLMVSILNASIHLRQEEKLISAILIALKDCLGQESITDTDMFFPNEFKNKLLEAINNITNSQTVVMLRTVIYHLKSDCLEMLQSIETRKAIVMLHATVELLVTLLGGIRIFECNSKFVSYKKFVVAFNDVKNILSLLMDKISNLNHDEKIADVLLTAIYSWNEMQRALKHYLPKTILEDLEPPILDTDWHKLIEKISSFDNGKCQNSANKLILQQVKSSHNLPNESATMINGLIGGIESCWTPILKFDTEVIPFLNSEQISKLTHLLLEDMTSNLNDCNEWMKILRKDNLQENRRFLMALLHSIFTRIGDLVPKSITRLICKYFNAEALSEAATLDTEPINDILTCIKGELLENKRMKIQDNVLCKIKVCLQVLLRLPLMFLSSNLRIIIFIFVFALRLECEQSNEVVSLCNTIFSDLLDRSNIDVFQYVEPTLLLQQLPQNRNIQKTLELFLRNCSYASLKKLIKSSTNSNKNMFFLLESMEYVKPKLNVDQRTVIKKAQKKLIKVMMKTLPCKITKAEDIKMLNLVVKINITDENMNDKLKDVVESTVGDVFVDDGRDISANELLEEGLQLVVVILHNKKIFQITNQTKRGVWRTLFKHPCVYVLHPLLESCEPKEFSEFLEELHAQLIKTLSSVDKDDLANICVIWNSMLKTNMSSDRNKLRLSAINNLIQTIQSVSIPESLWPNLLKLIQNILVAKHLYLPGYIIDMSIVLALKSLEENAILTSNESLVICNILLKMRTSLITDKIPSLLVLYRRILSVVVHHSKIDVSKSEEHAFKCLALDIEKFTSSLIKLKKDMARISPYLIADLMELLSETSVASFVKVSLQNCINLLISICDEHGIAFLSRTLPDMYYTLGTLRHAAGIRKECRSVWLDSKSRHKHFRICRTIGYGGHTY